MSIFEDWWTQKRTEIQTHKAKLDINSVKVLCYLAWTRGAKEELQKEVNTLRKATRSMNDRARRQRRKKK